MATEAEKIASQISSLKSNYGYKLDFMADEHRRWHTFYIASEYKYVLLVALLHAFFYFLLSAFGTGAHRRATFTQEWMKENFGEEHKEATGKEISGGGAED